jgi:hypothetical protein
MNLHTDTLTEQDLHDAAKIAGVSFDRLARKGSRSHDHKFDVLLTGSGSRNGGYYTRDLPGATWDEWGIFLNVLFERDPAMITYGAYRNREHFRWATGDRYDTLIPAEQHRKHRWEYYAPYLRVCACGASRRWEERRANR